MSEIVKSQNDISPNIHIGYKLPSVSEFLMSKLNDQEKQIFRLMFQARQVSKDDFCINFEPLWQSLEYSNKANAVRELKNCLHSGIDYDIIITNDEKSSNSQNLGAPRQQYLLNLQGAQLFAMHSRASKANEMRRLFIKIFNLICDYIALESSCNLIYNLAKEKEKVLLERTPKNLKLLYIADVSTPAKQIKKIGQTFDYPKRHKTHKLEFDNYILQEIILCKNHVDVEKLFKEDSFVKTRQTDVEDKKGFVQKECYTTDKDWNEEQIKNKFLQLAKMLEDREKANFDVEKYEHECEFELRKLELQLESEKLHIESEKLKLEQMRIKMQFKTEKLRQNTAIKQRKYEPNLPQIVKHSNEEQTDVPLQSHQQNDEEKTSTNHNTEDHDDTDNPSYDHSSNDDDDDDIKENSNSNLSKDQNKLITQNTRHVKAIKKFLEKYCEIDETYKVRVGKLRILYNKYASYNSLKYVDAPTFQALIENNNYKFKRFQNTRCFLGFRLKAEHMDDNEKYD